MLPPTPLLKYYGIYIDSAKICSGRSSTLADIPLSSAVVVPSRGDFGEPAGVGGEDPRRPEKG